MNGSGGGGRLFIKLSPFCCRGLDLFIDAVIYLSQKAFFLRFFLITCSDARGVFEKDVSWEIKLAWVLTGLLGEGIVVSVTATSEGIA